MILQGLLQSLHLQSESGCGCEKSSCSSLAASHCAKWIVDLHLLLVACGHLCHVSYLCVCVNKHKAVLCLWQDK